MHSGALKFHALQQQRPVFFLHARRLLHRASGELPATCCGFCWGFCRVLNQARFDLFVCGHGQQVGLADQGLEIWHSGADHKRLFLPILAHKLLWAEAAEQGKREFHIHGTILPERLRMLCLSREN